MNNPQLHRRAKEILADALERSPAERAPFVSNACGSDVDLLAEVQSLLKFADRNAAETRDSAHPARARLESLLAPETIASGSSSGFENNSYTADMPASVGRYKINRLIGEGGMGRVFEAVQEKPSRRVALKLIRAAHNNPLALRRFEYEAQTLGRLEHPLIARIYEAATDEVLLSESPRVVAGPAQPFIAMEFVEGQPLDRFVRGANLSIPQRLRLFLDVCRAVTHAHTNGVIHRDLKPNNILVAADGTPKVLDFGIARAVEEPDGLTMTHTGQPIGTPAYMSPEQALGESDIDTRSDVYSLGIVLYELLTNVTPFRLQKRHSASIVELQRLICDVDPPKPSTAISAENSDADGGIGFGIESLRRVRSIVEGELDWIVLKAIEKDRARRYQSVAEFAADVERYLAGQAVVAAPPSRMYLIRKTMRRHRGAFTAGAAIFGVLLVGLIGFAWQARVARAERDKAERIAEFMSDMLKGVGPSFARGRDVTMLKEMMDGAAKRIENGDLANAAEAEFRLRLTIGDAYRDLSLFPEAKKLLAPALEQARQLYSGDSPLFGKALFHNGTLERERGDLEIAEKHLRESVAVFRKMYPEGHHDLAETLAALGAALFDRGALDQATGTWNESLQVLDRISAGDDPERAACLNNLANVQYLTAKYDESERNGLAALSIYERLYSSDHPRIASSLLNLGALYEAKSDFPVAERYLHNSLAMAKRLYPPGHHGIAQAQSVTGSFYFARGDFANAESLFKEALGTFEQKYTGDHTEIATMLNNIAACSFSRGDLAAAEEMYRQSIDMQRRLKPDNAMVVAPAIQNLCHLRLKRKDFAGADRSIAELIDALRRQFPEGHPQLAGALNMRGLILGDSAQPEAAERCWLEAIDIWRSQFPNGNVNMALGLCNYAGLLERCGNFVRGEALTCEAIDMLQRLGFGKNWECGYARLRLGRALAEQRQFEEAEVELLEGQQILANAPAAPAGRRSESVVALARLYEAWNDAESRPETEIKIVLWNDKLNRLNQQLKDTITK